MDEYFPAPELYSYMTLAVLITGLTHLATTEQPLARFLFHGQPAT
jgi:hypothetical protein